MEPTAAPKAWIAPAFSARLPVLCIGRPGTPGGGGSSPSVRRRETSDARETGVARRGVRAMGRPTVSGPEGPDVKGRGGGPWFAGWVSSGCELALRDPWRRVADRGWGGKWVMSVWGWQPEWGWVQEQDEGLAR
jgi:hypothetical protein